MQEIKHIAIIMDGNGRWASEHNLPRSAGHFEGSKNVRNISIKASNLDIKVLTLYAFSTENWKRSKVEIDYLMKLPSIFFKEYLSELMSHNIKIRTIGDISKFPLNTKKVLENAVTKTAGNSGMILNFAMNYGSHDEIVKAANLVYELKKLNPDIVIDQKLFESCLMTNNFPNVDMLIRTSGEKRLSNFLLYQLAYSELIFVDKAWPEFNASDFEDCIQEFEQRDRRFGGTK